MVMLNISTLTGLTIGQYVLKEQLGAGGMGVVYRAYQPTLEREVAVKVLPTMLAGQEGYIERFTREARTAASLEHTHIVPIYDYGTQQDVSYVVMRMLTGGTLAQRAEQRIEAKKPLPSPGEVSQMLKEIASALDYAHSRGVIHRDIKAGNIMFDLHGSAYLVDFGIAKLKDSLGVTSSGLAIGTPTHMSPEQWRGEDVVPATDQYALGVVIYEVLSGRLPFESATAYALMNKHLNEPPTPLHTVRPDLPIEIEAVLQRVMAKDPQDRFPTVTDFANAFEGAIDGKQGSSTQFFTFPVRPIRLKADGELPSSLVRHSAPSGAYGNNSEEVLKAKNRLASPDMKRLRKTVEQRIAKRKEFLMDFVAYVLIIPLLWVIHGIFGPPNIPWALFATLGWGAGLVMHGIDTFYQSGAGDRLKEREIRRELKRQGADPNMDISAIMYPEKDDPAWMEWMEKMGEKVSDRVSRHFSEQGDAVHNDESETFIEETPRPEERRKRGRN